MKIKKKKYQRGTATAKQIEVYKKNKKVKDEVAIAVAKTFFPPVSRESMMVFKATRPLWTYPRAPERGAPVGERWMPVDLPIWSPTFPKTDPEQGWRLSQRL
jgi:hypothetical protein